MATNDECVDFGASIKHFLDISRPGVSVVEVVFQSIRRMLELHCSLVHALAVFLVIPVSVFQVLMQALAESLSIAFHSTEQLLHIVVAHPVGMFLPSNAHHGPERQTDCYYDK
jgi:hypothetical protein